MMQLDQVSAADIHLDELLHSADDEADWTSRERHWRSFDAYVQAIAAIRAIYDGALKAELRRTTTRASRLSDWLDRDVRPVEDPLLDALASCEPALRGALGEHELVSRVWIAAIEEAVKYDGPVRLESTPVLESVVVEILRAASTTALQKAQVRMLTHEKVRPGKVRNLWTIWPREDLHFARKIYLDHMIRQNAAEDQSVVGWIHHALDWNQAKKRDVLGPAHSRVGPDDLEKVTIGVHTFWILADLLIPADGEPTFSLPDLSRKSAEEQKRRDSSTPTPDRDAAELAAASDDDGSAWLFGESPDDAVTPPEVATTWGWCAIPSLPEAVWLVRRAVLDDGTHRPQPRPPDVEDVGGQIATTEPEASWSALRDSLMRTPHRPGLIIKESDVPGLRIHAGDGLSIAAWTRLEELQGARERIMSPPETPTAPRNEDWATLVWGLYRWQMATALLLCEDSAPAVKLAFPDLLIRWLELDAPTWLCEHSADGHAGELRQRPRPRETDAFPLRLRGRARLAEDYALRLAVEYCGDTQRVVTAAARETTDVKVLVNGISAALAGSAEQLPGVVSILQRHESLHQPETTDRALHQWDERVAHVLSILWSISEVDLVIREAQRRRTGSDVPPSAGFRARFIPCVRSWSPAGPWGRERIWPKAGGGDRPDYSWLRAKLALVERS